MKLADVQFKANDCCGEHLSATVILKNGQEIGLLKGDDTYTITYYGNGGMTGREIRVSAERVEQVLAG